MTEARLDELHGYEQTCVIVECMLDNLIAKIEDMEWDCDAEVYESLLDMCKVMEG